MRVGSLLLIGAAILAGCATVSEMAATGGSRSDGIVRLSFEAGMFDKIDINELAALHTARLRCNSWGYSSAEAFGGHTRQCQQSSGYGCMRWLVTKEYQCTNGATLAPPPVATAVPVIGQPAAHGPRKIRANTPSGYCLDVADDYVGTGSSSRPAVSNAMPRCSSLSAD